MVLCNVRVNVNSVTEIFTRACAYISLFLIGIIHRKEKHDDVSRGARQIEGQWREVRGAPGA
jgi:hypothetical protein